MWFIIVLISTGLALTGLLTPLIWLILIPYWVCFFIGVAQEMAKE